VFFGEKDRFEICLLISGFSRNDAVKQVINDGTEASKLSQPNSSSTRSLNSTGPGMRFEKTELLKPLLAQGEIDSRRGRPYSSGGNEEAPICDDEQDQSFP
jgi:hypothetical protein